MGRRETILTAVFAFVFGYIVCVLRTAQSIVNQPEQWRATIDEAEQEQMYS